MIDAARVSIDERTEKSKELGRPSALNLHFNFKPSSLYSMATLLADLATELRMPHLDPFGRPNHAVGGVSSAKAHAKRDTDPPP